MGAAHARRQYSDDLASAVEQILSCGKDQLKSAILFIAYCSSLKESLDIGTLFMQLWFVQGHLNLIPAAHGLAMLDLLWCLAVLSYASLSLNKNKQLLKHVF